MKAESKSKTESLYIAIILYKSSEQVYATILYYLQNKETVSTYMKNWIEHGHKMREKQRLNPPPVSEKLRQLRIERQAKV